MSDDMLNDFRDETAELLQQFEDNLLKIQEEGFSDTVINTLFRSIHTIKGIAGMFDFSFIVDFTHIGESLLDKIRNKEIELDNEKINVFLKVKDHIQNLIAFAIEFPNDIPEDEDPLTVKSEELSAVLGGYIRGGEEDDEDGDQEEENAIKLWKIVLKPFKKETSFYGVEPYQFIYYLTEVGSIESIETNIDSIPEITDINLDYIYMSFEIIFKSLISKKEIEQIFDFIATLLSYEITPYDRRSENRNSEKDENIVNDRRILNVKSETNNSGSAAKISTDTVQNNELKKDTVKAAQNNKVQKKAVKGGGSGGGPKATTLRVDSARVDSLINLIGEMVIANANVVQKAMAFNNKELLEATSNLTNMLEDLRENGMKMRMLPIGDTFNRFKRIVHDVSSKLGKHIDLEIYGGETELDKTVIEKINDPLVHIIRNSLDHGIEFPEERVDKGKDEKGLVRIGAYHEAGSIVIEITDDGKGLNPQILFDKAVEKNLIESDAQLSDKEIFKLIFLPGFSTAVEVSDISGRGVGMEVVKKNIDLLRGEIDIESEIDKGTKISIRLPLTLAIIDGFMIQSGSLHFIVPLDMVVECIELSPAINKNMKENNFINLRGNILPLFDMNNYFETDSKAVKKNIVIVKYGNQTIGLVVDKLLGEFQTVIKPLGKIFKNVKGLSGATILGSGEVALILDIPILIGYAGALKRKITENIN